ncbi:MAG: molybdenum ABC transporter ATP-binding protein [Spirochaetaceae bacterium 4572_59]|nr:MAG: molybdenum ABC transporter ATP-binding protein [Spirochaetaceae bacterium 4572_59]
MITFENIVIKYNDFVAINDFNLEIEEGEFFTLLGPSGCGKTTLLRSVVGFIDVFSGRIKVKSDDITNLPTEKRNIGIVFQSYALFPTMNVFENIAFGLKVKNLGKEEIEKEVYEIAAKVDLNEKQLLRNVSELSGGQQQRVAIARALVLKPRILCLDEPLSNLDAKLRGQLRMELKKLQRDFGITTIYVTHDQEEALTLSDRIAVFNKGHLEQVGTPHEIYNESESEFVCDFIGDINKINGNVIDTINSLSDKKFDRNKTAFLRTERVLTKCNDSEYIKLNSEIVDYEYNGLFTKYYYRVNDGIIMNVEKNDGLEYSSIGGKIDLYINPADIKQF